MKSATLILLLLAFNFFAHSQINLTSGLVAYYPFSGDYLDHSGNGHNGVTYNMTLTTDKKGNTNSAAFFDGFSSWIDIATSSTPTSYLTVAFKFKAASDRGQILISKSDYITAANWTGDYQYVLGFNYPGMFVKDGLFFSTNHTNSCLVPPNGTLTDYAFTGTHINDSRWYCVVETFDTGIKRIYVDGVLAVQQIVTGAYSKRIDSCVGGTLKLGTWWKNDPEYFYGTMDEVRIYNRVLNAAEISALCTDQVIVISKGYNATSVCQGGKVVLPFTVTAPYNAGNVFTAQLSDSSGSFASAVVIGTDTVTTSDSIKCTIPQNTVAGSHYRIRIISSNPVSVSEDNGSDISVLSFTIPVISTNSPVCAGNTLNINLTDTAAGVAFLWNGPNHFTASTKSISVSNAQIADSGLYTVDVAAPNGCKDTLSVTADVISGGSNLGVTIAVAPNDTLCSGIPATFTATVKNGGSSITYQWKKNGVDIPGATSSTYTDNNPTDGETITCAVTSGNTCLVSQTAISDGITMHILSPLGKLLITISSYPGNYVPSGPNTFTANIYSHPSSMFTYQWKKNGKNIPGATSDSLICDSSYHPGDKLTVMVTSKYPCAATDSAESYIVALGISVTNRNATDLVVSPNPGNGNFHVSGIIGSGKTVTVEMINMLGQIVYKSNIAALHGVINTTLSMPDIANGVYILKLSNEQEYKKMKVTVDK